MILLDTHKLMMAVRLLDRAGQRALLMMVITGICISLAVTTFAFLIGVHSSMTLARVTFYSFVPETKGISLESIEKNIMEGKALKEIGSS